jgi:hypothetical protein
MCSCDGRIGRKKGEWNVYYFLVSIKILCGLLYPKEIGLFFYRLYTKAFPF